MKNTQVVESKGSTNEGRAFSAVRSVKSRFVLAVVQGKAKLVEKSLDLAAAREVSRAQAESWLSARGFEQRMGPEAGFTGVINLLISAGVGIVGLIILFAYIIPQAYVSSSNMTVDLTNAGAAPASIQWWKWLMWGGIVLDVILTLVALVNQRSGGVGVGGGGGRRRRRR